MEILLWEFDGKFVIEVDANPLKEWEVDQLKEMTRFSLDYTQ